MIFFRLRGVMMKLIFPNEYARSFRRNRRDRQDKLHAYSHVYSEEWYKNLLVNLKAFSWSLKV
jgi:hypothetical protein